MSGARTPFVHPRALLYSGFVLTGVVTTVLGPALPWLASRWELSDAAAGSLFTVQFAGGLTAGALSGVVASRIGVARTLAVGYALMAIGLMMMAVSGREAGIVGIATAGLGLGCVSPLTNLMAARLTPARAAAALGAVNLCWGLGAASWPLAAAVSVNRGGLQPALAIVSALLAVLVVPFARAAFPPDVPHAATGGDRSSPISFVRLGAFGLCIALYAGTEAAVGGWVTEYARRIASGVDASRWELAASVFWGGLTAGRAAVAVWLTRRWETTALFGGIASIALAIVLLLLAPGIGTVLGAALLCGAGLGPVFPVTVAGLAREFPTRMAGPMVALGSLGAGTLPLAVGALSDRTGSLATGFAALEVFVAVLFALQLWRVAPTSPPGRPSKGA
jgi:FHS family glucose/mannose:H+ symporter-like MFS transporter